MNITWEIIAMFLALGGAVAGGFWRIWALIDSAKKDALLRAEAGIALASLARDELSAHKLHVAETYTTKQSLAEQTQQIMRAIESLGDKIDRMDGRIDGVMMAKPSTRTRSQ